MPNQSEPNHCLPIQSQPKFTNPHLTAPDPNLPYPAAPFRVRTTPFLTTDRLGRPDHAMPYYSKFTIPNRPNVGRKSPTPINRPADSMVSRNALRSTYSGSKTIRSN